MAGASSLGGCIGKMLSPQSIALGVGAVGALAEGKEGEIMRGTAGYCLCLLVIAGILTFIILAVGALFTYRNSKSYKEEEAF